MNREERRRLATSLVIAASGASLGFGIAQLLRGHALTGWACIINGAVSMIIYLLLTI